MRTDTKTVAMATGLKRIFFSAGKEVGEKVLRAEAKGNKTVAKVSAGSAARFLDGFSALQDAVNAEGDVRSRNNTFVVPIAFIRIDFDVPNNG